MENDNLKEYGTDVLQGNGKRKIQLMTIIGEIEGHENLPASSKTTKYEHILPKLANIEDNEDIAGVLIIENSTGGSVESGLAIAEMIASLSKPTVSLVIGDGHSIGIPIAVAADHSFIVPSATMMVHPVRGNGTYLGVIQTYRNMEKIQDRITSFVAGHSGISQERLEELMLDTREMTKDVGTLLSGEEAVKEGLMDEIGGISQAIAHLRRMIDANCKK